ncbi:hypothetical protein NEOLEDRAFT_1136877, partial [Neolentinus lepideus HHB14362 ss-1]
MLRLASMHVQGHCPDSCQPQSIQTNDIISKPRYLRSSPSPTPYDGRYGAIKIL